MSSNRILVMFTTLALATQAAADEKIGTCNSVTVAGFPEGTCIRSSCGLCTKYTESLNGVYTRIADVTNQMVDPLDASLGKLPVYVKRTSDEIKDPGSGIIVFESIEWLYFDALEAAYYDKELNGWAIGPAIGTACTDDSTYCSCGNIPAACCTIGPACAAYYAKQTEQGWTEDLACETDAPSSRSGPQGIVDTDPWKIIERTSSGGTYCSSSSSDIKTDGIKIVCSDAGDIIDDLPSSGDFLFEVRDCPMAWSSIGVADDCRKDRCQGCSPSATPPACTSEEETCLCEDDVVPIARPVEAPVASPVVVTPVSSPVEAPAGAPSVCEGCSRKGSDESCTTDEECCSFNCKGKRNRKTCSTYIDPCVETPVSTPVTTPLSPPTEGCIIDSPSNCGNLNEEACNSCGVICEWSKKRGGQCYGALAISPQPQIF